MRRFIEAVTVAEVAVPLTLAALATMPVATDPASAQGGCKAFGTGRLWEFNELQNGTLREEIRIPASVNYEVRFFHGMLCW